VLDVDGHVISAEDLVQRVQELLRLVEADGPVDGPAARVGSSPVAPVATGTDHLMHAMRDLQVRLQPPDLGQAAGVRGQSARFVKRAVRKLTSWYVEPRWVLQQIYDGYNLDVASLVVLEARRLDQEAADLRRHNTTLKLQLITSLERVNQLRSRFDEFTSEALKRHSGLEMAIHEALRTAASQDDVRAIRQQLAGLLERLGAAGSSGAAIDYVAFEDRFRGSGDQVEVAQKRYLTLYPPAGVPGRILDIGCGRGEMLSLLREAGHDVIGVDLDPGMVAACKAKDLPVIEDDGIHLLERTEDASLKGIFCAQVVEHLLTSELEQLVRLSFEKLRPGGVLVIETINPRSSFALGNHFYADTSHVRPVHPETLRFICEQVGFSLVQLEERSPHPMFDLVGELPEDKMGSAVEALLTNVFGYQDYVIAATK